MDNLLAILLGHLVGGLIAEKQTSEQKLKNFVSFCIAMLGIVLGLLISLAIFYIVNILIV